MARRWDYLGAAALVAGGLGILALIGGVMLGVGMILVPVKHDDGEVGAACMLITSVACGAPGVAAFFFGVFALGRRNGRDLPFR